MKGARAGSPTPTAAWARAAFVVLAAGLAVPAVVARAYHPGPGRILCESQAHRHTYCRTGAVGRVRLDRRLSSAPCREYDTWGADGDGRGVWVRDGCRAIFTVVPWGGPARPAPPELRITCKSQGFKPSYCRLPRWGQVRLERRLSSTPCRQYDTWGVDGGGIWVDRGCAAVFAVR